MAESFAERQRRRRQQSLTQRLGGRRQPKRRRATREEINARAREEGPGILGRLGEALAVPGDLARGGIEQIIDALDDTRDVPFQKRTAREFLEEVVGVTPPEFDINNLLSTGTLGGASVLATDIATDPLSLVTGIGQFGKGTKAAIQAQKSARVGQKVGRLGGALEAPLSAQAGKRVRGALADVPGVAGARPFEQLPRLAPPGGAAATAGFDVESKLPTFNLEDLFKGVSPEELSGLDIEDILRELPRDTTAFGLPRSQVAEIAKEQLDRAKTLSAEAKAAGFGLPTQAQKFTSGANLAAKTPRQPEGLVIPAAFGGRGEGQRETLKALIEAPTIGELPRATPGAGVLKNIGTVGKKLREQFTPQSRPFETGAVDAAGKKILAKIPTRTEPAARNLIEIGLGGKRRFRVGLPGQVGQKIEARIAQIVGTPLVFAGRLIARPFRKAVGGSKEAAQAAKILKGLLKSRLVGRAKFLKKEQESLITKNVIDNIIATGNPPDEIVDTLRDQLFTDLTNARQLGTARVEQIYGKEAALFVRDLDKMVRQATASQFARGARNDSLISDYAERILSPAGRAALKEAGKADAYRSFLVDQANLWENSQFSRKDYTRDALNTDAERFFREELGLTDIVDNIDLNKIDDLLAEDYGSVLRGAFSEVDDIAQGKSIPSELAGQITDNIPSNLLMIKAGMSLDDRQFASAYLKFLVEDKGMRLPEAMDVIRGLPDDLIREKSITIAELQNLQPADAGSKFFNLNPAETVSRTVRERSMTVINAELAQSFIKDLRNVPGRAGDMELGKFIKAVGLRRFGNQSFKANDLGAINRALESAGLRATDTVPAEAAAEFIKIYGKFEQLAPAKFRKFVEEVWDPLNSVFRIGATAPIPFIAFHSRNFFSNVMLNYLGGVTAGKHYIDAFKQFFTTNEAAAKFAGVKFDARRAELYSGLGLTKGGQLGEIADTAAQQLESGKLRDSLGLPPVDFAAAAVGTTLKFFRQNPLSRAGFALGTFVEDTSRIAHFLAKKNKGLTNAEAVGSVNKFLFDYSNEALNGMEQGLLNRLFFFYRWQRFALPLVVNTFLEDPRRAAILLKATTQPGVERPAGIPEFIREAAGIPAGPVDPETGEQPFVSRFGSPLEVLGALDPTTSGAQQFGAFGGGVKLGRELVQQSVPPIRAAFEFISGRDFFLGRDLNELDKADSLQALIGESIGATGFGEEVPRPTEGETRFRTRPDVRFLLRNLPTSRLTQTISRLASLTGIPTAIGEATGAFQEDAVRSEKSTGEEILRTILGVSLADVNVEEEAKRRAQRVLGTKLGEAQLSGEAGQLPIFIPTEKTRRKGPTDPVNELLEEFRRVAESRPTSQPISRERLGSASLGR